MGVLHYALTLEGLDFLWSRSKGHPDVRVVVLDGSADIGHPCFVGASLQCVEILAGAQCNPRPRSSHGTHISSILFGQHSSDLHGVAPSCTGSLLPVFAESEQGGLLPCSQSELAQAIVQAARLGANVINISAGEYSPDGKPDDDLQMAILEASRTAVIVAAAGNDGCSCAHIPAALSGVIAVGACSADGRPLPHSNWDVRYSRNGILAPGEGIPGASPGGGYATRTGTSYATALVSGVTALLLSLQLHVQGRIDVRGVREALIHGASPCTTEGAAARCLAGRLDIRNTYAFLFSRKGESTMSVEQTPARSGGESDRGAGSQGIAPADLSSLRGLMPSECACGNQTPPAKVFAIGSLGYDFVSEARKSSFIQAMNLETPLATGDLLRYLDAHPYAASSMTWTLSLDSTPVYIIMPLGPFAVHGYERLRQFMKSQAEGDLRVSIAGVIGGEGRLLSGQAVPVVLPDLRAMYSWSSTALLSAVTDPTDTEVRAGLGNFLDRIYDELRNLGARPEDRALNFAATNAYQANQIFQSAVKEKLELDAIAVERSPIGRPGSDCWDVKLTFFDPLRRQDRARKTYRFTIDVSDVVPVAIGDVRSWSIY